MTNHYDIVLKVNTNYNDNLAIYSIFSYRMSYIYFCLLENILERSLSYKFVNNILIF